MELKAGYKQTEVGVVPQEWEVSTIDRVFQFKQGVQTPIEQQSAVEVEKSKRFIRIVDLTNPQEEWRYIADPGASHHVTKTDLFMVRYGSPGLVGFGHEGVIANNLFRLIPRKKIDCQFFYQYLANRQDEIAGISGSSTMPAVTFSTLNLLYVVCPSLSEQRAIAAALSDVDALLAKLDALIAKKRDLKQAAMQQLLTGQTRLPGFSGEWEVVKAADIGRFRGGSGFPIKFQGATAGEYPFFKVSDMNNAGNGTFMDTANNYISEELRKQLGAIAFPAKSIVFAKVGAAVFLERKKILRRASCIDNNMAAFVIDACRANCRFIHCLLLNTKLGNLVSTTALPSLSGSVLSAIELPLPSLPEQIGIAEVLSDMDEELAALTQRRDKTRALKQGMMQELLTGRIRLV